MNRVTIEFENEVDKEAFCSYVREYGEAIVAWRPWENPSVEAVPASIVEDGRCGE